MIVRTKQQGNVREQQQERNKRRKRWRVVSADQLNAELGYSTMDIQLAPKQSRDTAAGSGGPAARS